MTRHPRLHRPPCLGNTAMACSPGDNETPGPLRACKGRGIYTLSISPTLSSELVAGFLRRPQGDGDSTAEGLGQPQRNYSQKSLPVVSPVASGTFLPGSPASLPVCVLLNLIPSGLPSKPHARPLVSCLCGLSASRRWATLEVAGESGAIIPDNGRLTQYVRFPQ